MEMLGAAIRRECGPATMGRETRLSFPHPTHTASTAGARKFLAQQAQREVRESTLQVARAVLFLQMRSAHGVEDGRNSDDPPRVKETRQGAVRFKLGLEHGHDVATEPGQLGRVALRRLGAQREPCQGGVRKHPFRPGTCQCTNAF
jgi:hypothetical protein